MVLVIDNYDSFTYNLVQYLGELGEEVVVRRNDEITLDEVAALKPDRIVVSPGPCTPTEAGISVPLIERFAGNLDFCIAIRSILLEGGKAYIQAGAGIVADSNPTAEYEETRDKARAMLRALELAQGGL